MHGLRLRIAEPQNVHEEEITKRFSSVLTPEFAQLVGEFVTATPWAEDAGGTLLQASSGEWDMRAKAYDETSSSLVKALRKVAPTELIDRLLEALELRHFVVHGIFIGGKFMPSPVTGAPP